jgi:hypothetical protein
VPHPSCAPPEESALPFAFVRGDVVRRGASGPPSREGIDVADSVGIVDFLRGETALACPDSADVDDDGKVDSGDVVALCEALLGGRAPPGPFPAPGLDPSADDLPCNEAGRLALIPAGALWRYWNDATPPPAGWHQPGADDGEWEEGASGIGIGAEGLRTVLGGGWRSVLYARRAFAFEAAAAPAGLLLDLDYNDGFVAYLNGVEVARSGLGEPGFEVPSGVYASSHAGGAPEAFHLCAELLRSGENVLALEVHNRSALDSSLFFSARLLGLEALEPPPEPDPPPSPGARLYLETERPPNVGDGGEIRVLVNTGEPLRAVSLVLEFDRAALLVYELLPGEAVGGAAFERVALEARGGRVSAIFLADLPEERGEPFGAGEGLELARLRYHVTAQVPQETTVAFGERSGLPASLPLANVLVTADARSLEPLLEDLHTEITALATPLIRHIHGGRGSPGTSFFVVGSRFDRPGLEVRVCGRAAEFALLGDNQTLSVVAPPCQGGGYAAVEVCTGEGCAVEKEGFFYTAAGPLFVRGDANGDARVDISDAIAMLGQLFLGVPAQPSCASALDANSDGRFDISDGIFVLYFLFQGAGEIAPPYPDAAPCP